jgi:hypothetical protein
MQNWRRTAALREPAGAHEIHACDVPLLSQKMTGGARRQYPGPGIDRNEPDQLSLARKTPCHDNREYRRRAALAVCEGACRPLLRMQGEPAPRHRQAAQARADDSFIRLLRAIPSIPAIAEAVDAVGAAVPTGRAVVERPAVAEVAAMSTRAAALCNLDDHCAIGRIDGCQRHGLRTSCEKREARGKNN